MKNEYNYPKNDGLPFPPEDIDPTRGGTDLPPFGMVWIYTCPKCGDKMYAPEYWDAIIPPPITCRKCGYTIKGKMYEVTC